MFRSKGNGSGITGLVEATDSRETEALLAAFLRMQPLADLDFSTTLLENLQLMDQQMSARLQERDAALLACHNTVAVPTPSPCTIPILSHTGLQALPRPGFPSLLSIHRQPMSVYRPFKADCGCSAIGRSGTTSPVSICLGHSKLDMSVAKIASLYRTYSIAVIASLNL